MSDETSPPSTGPGRPERLDELLRPPPRPRLSDRLSWSWRSVAARSEHGSSRRSSRRLIASALVVAAIGGGWWWRSHGSRAAFDLATLPRAGTTAASVADSTAVDPVGSGGGTGSTPGSRPDTTELTVDVAGAVVDPGVRRLPAGSRVADAIAAAGGARPDADLDRVNRAASLLDGARIWVPIRDRPDPSPVAVETSTGSPTGGAATPSVPVDLNSATAEQLDSLPGVGPATAAAIVAHRSAHGRFATVEALGDVRGIGPAKLETLRPLVRVGP